MVKQEVIELNDTAIRAVVAATPSDIAQASVTAAWLEQDRLDTLEQELRS